VDEGVPYLLFSPFYSIQLFDPWISHMQRADPQTIQKFETFNRPFRPLSRHCSSCGGEVVVASPPDTSSEGREKFFFFFFFFFFFLT